MCLLKKLKLHSGLTFESKAIIAAYTCCLQLKCHWAITFKMEHLNRVLNTNENVRKEG